MPATPACFYLIGPFLFSRPWAAPLLVLAGTEDRSYEALLSLAECQAE